MNPWNAGSLDAYMAATNQLRMVAVAVAAFAAAPLVENSADIWIHGSKQYFVAAILGLGGSVVAGFVSLTMQGKVALQEAKNASLRGQLQLLYEAGIRGDLENWKTEAQSVKRDEADNAKDAAKLVKNMQKSVAVQILLVLAGCAAMLATLITMPAG